MTFARVARPMAAIALVLGCNGLVFSQSQSDDFAQANQFLKQGELGRALDRADAYLLSRPKDARGRFLKGVILAEQKKSNEAIKVFTELTFDYPELAEPYNNLAVLYAAQGEYDKARTALEMAIRTNPGYAAAHENLGDIYAQMARQAYDKAAKLDRTNKTAPAKMNLVRELLSKPPAK